MEPAKLRQDRDPVQPDCTVTNISTSLLLKWGGSEIYLRIDLQGQKSSGSLVINTILVIQLPSSTIEEDFFLTIEFKA